MKGIEAHLTTTPSYITERQNSEKIWLKSADDFTTNSHLFKTSQNYKGVRNGQNYKYSKGKSNSYTQNQVGNGRNHGDKPSKRDKWNFNREDELSDDYLHWDSINNHAENTGGKKKSLKEVNFY